ncbi:hypothetical protein [Demequina iriomotensis]|uniref:hypothetical protein n=1 Tax=Demequina iriomotensis TaxID=1536641 RepID=UPI000783005D|nr:hypothetical protein [Demequina iriomotensis]
MRINNGVKAALLATTAGMLLAACSSDADTDASPSASAASAAPDVAAIAEQVNTATGCDTFGGSWAGGRVAGEGVLAGWEFTCDVEGDGVVETTVAIYETADALESDLANREAATADTAILRGEGYLVTTTDASHLASVANLGAETVRELPAAE